MKNILLFIVLVIMATSCSTNRYYFSKSDFDSRKTMANAGVSPSPTVGSINGRYFTCNCSRKYVKQSYRKAFQDVVLVKKNLQKGDTITSIRIK